MQSSLRRCPVVYVSLAWKSVMELAYLAVDELEIPGALRVAVTSAVLRASLVARVLLQTTICVHGYEVECTIEATRQLRHINVKGKLLIAGKFKHFVCRVVLHQVGTRSNVCRIRALRDELQRQ